MPELVRFGVSISAGLLESFDKIIEKKGYSSRSEAIRDLIRNQIVKMEWESGDEEVAGTITLVYDHHVRGLSNLLLEVQHDYHDLILSTMHLHLDHHNCLEVLAIQGATKDIREISERLISIKGVKHGQLTITSTGKNLP